MSRGQVETWERRFIDRKRLAESSSHVQRQIVGRRDT